DGVQGKHRSLQIRKDAELDQYGKLPPGQRLVPIANDPVLLPDIHADGDRHPISPHPHEFFWFRDRLVHPEMILAFAEESLMFYQDCSEPFVITDTIRSPPGRQPDILSKIQKFGYNFYVEMRRIIQSCDDTSVFLRRDPFCRF